VGSRAADESQQVASKAADEAQAVASTAQEKGQAVVGVATRQARQVGASAKEQADKVRGEVVDQARSLAEEARTQVESQAHAQSRRLADTLSRLGDEVRALAEGRPDDADTLQPYVSDAATAIYDAADRVYGLAQDLDERGLTPVLDDLQAFARRRPGVFLLGAAVAGLGVGRAVRAAKGGGEDVSAPMVRGR
jgi:gas vesicle protein